MDDRPRETGHRLAAAAPTILTIVVGVGGFAAHLLRQSGHPSWDTVWAEDGPVYASDALSLPAPSTLLRAYAGYAQFVPRVLALAMRVLPIAAEAAYFAVVASLVWALLAMFVFRHSEQWLNSTALRLLLCATFVAAPSAGYEVSANLANLGWPLLFAAFWAVMSRRQGRFDVATRALVVALSALTTPLTAFLLPWCVIRIVRQRSTREGIVGAALVAALGIQAIPMLAAPVDTVAGSHAGDLPIEYGQRVIGSVALGDGWLPSVWKEHGTTAVWVITLALVALVLVARPWRLDRARVWFASSAAFLSGLLFAIPALTRDAGHLRPVADRFGEIGSRYVVVPALLLLTAIIVVVDRSGRRWLGHALVVYGLVVVVTSYGVATPRSLGPAWSTQIDATKAACAESHAPDVPVPITPSAEGWIEAVPCDRLEP